MRAWISGRNYSWRVCGAVRRARWHCYWYSGLMEDGGGGMGRGGGVAEGVYVHAALSEEGMESWIVRA